MPQQVLMKVPDHNVSLRHLGHPSGDALCLWGVTPSASCCPTTGDREVVDALTLGAVGQREHVAEAIQPLLPCHMQSRIHPIQLSRGSLSRMVVGVGVLLQLMRLPFCQHLSEQVPLALSNVSTGIAPVLRRLGGFCGHVEVSQENAVRPTRIWKMLPDGAPESSSQDRCASALLDARGRGSIYAQYLKVTVCGVYVYREGVTTGYCGGLKLPGDCHRVNVQDNDRARSAFRVVRVGGAINLDIAPQSLT